MIESYLFCKLNKSLKMTMLPMCLYLSGEISLRPAATNLLGGNLVKGNVYLDEKPVCDDGFGREEARVVCRSFLHFSDTVFCIFSDTLFSTICNVRLGPKGRMRTPKQMNFRKSSKGEGGGSFSIQKFMLQILDFK